MSCLRNLAHTTSLARIPLRAQCALCGRNHRVVRLRHRVLVVRAALLRGVQLDGHRHARHRHAQLERREIWRQVPGRQEAAHPVGLVRESKPRGAANHHTTGVEASRRSRVDVLCLPPSPRLTSETHRMPIRNCQRPGCTATVSSLHGMMRGL